MGVEIRVFEFDKEKGGYRVELQCDDGSNERGFLKQSSLPDLRACPTDERGKALFEWLFADANLAAHWAELRGRYPQRRIRLNIDLAADLHQIPWELLREPLGDAGTSALAEQESTPFSRYREGRSPGPLLERPIRLLVAIADPGNLKEDWNLFQIEGDAEWSEFQNSLEGIGAGSFELERLEGPCTLEAIEKKLRTTPGYHVLHFIGHGGIKDNQTFLCLADRDNQVKPTLDVAVQGMIHNLLGDGSSDNSLRMMFLASCETACISGSTGLAPKLLEGGVPTVVAMHGKVPVRTAHQFSRVFYQELLAHGEVDRASNRARATLRTTANPGGEIPVLFSRLLDGLLFAEPEKQVNLDDLQKFLARNFDAKALESLSNGLGVKWDPANGDVAAQARSLIRRFEAEHRLEVLVAEALSRAQSDAQPLRRVSLSDELRELLAKRDASNKQQKELNTVEQAIKAGRIREAAAGKAVGKLQSILQEIRTAGANLDDSDLPGVGERLGRFLEREGNTEAYKLAVAAPMIPLVLTSKEGSNLALDDIRDLKRIWNALSQPPAWKRPQLLAPVLGLLIVLALCTTEYGWRWPLHIWPSDLLKSSEIWSDNFRDPKSGKWQCGPPAQSCEQYLTSGEMRLPKGVIAMPARDALKTKSLYDFGVRFRFQMEDSTTRVSWFFRQYPHQDIFAGGPRGYRFTLTRQGDGAKTTLRLGSNMQEAKDTFKDYPCAIRQSADFSVEAAAVGQHFYVRITVNRMPESDLASGPCGHSDFLASEFWEERWVPRALFGNLAVGDADGKVRFIQEVTVYSAKEALESLKPEP